MGNQSIKPADNSTFTGLVKTIQDRVTRNIENMLPAKVINFDRVKNRVTVQPLIRVVGTDGNTIGRDQLFSIPVYNPSGGGFGVYFPLVPGNLGWIIANDRDISLFLQGYKESNPNTTRKHTFSDAIFYPDLMTGYSIDGEDTNNLTVQNLDASVKITLSQDTIKLKATNIVSDCDNFTVNSKNTIINATTKLNVTSPESEFSAIVNVMGLLSASAYSGLVGGNMTTNVNINTSGNIICSDAIVSGKNVNGHNHNGIVPSF